MEWARSDELDELELHFAERTGELVPPGRNANERPRMALASSGARATLTWLNPECRAVEKEASGLPIHFGCGDAACSTPDGRLVTKFLPMGRHHILPLERVPARMLMLLLERGTISPLPKEEIWRAVWPERSSEMPSESLIRQTIHRVCRKFKPASLIRAIQPSGIYALNAGVSLWMDGHRIAPDGLKRIPMRFVLPVYFCRYGPKEELALTLHEIRAVRPDGQCVILGFGPDTTLGTIKTLLNATNPSGGSLMDGAGLRRDESPEVDTLDGPIRRIGHAEPSHRSLSEPNGGDQVDRESRHPAEYRAPRTTVRTRSKLRTRGGIESRGTVRAR